MTGRLAGKVAVVSGGARGMGASHVRALVDEGAKVVLGDILDAEGEVVAKEVGDAARYVHLDVTQPDDWGLVVATAVEQFGGVDILVNNAGIINVGLIEDYELSEWHRILDINLTGVFLGIRAVVKPMKAAGRGSIINISSIGWMVPSVGMPVYVTAKAATVGLTRTLAHELGRANIRVNTVLPGAIVTERQERLWFTPEYKAEILANQAIKRHLEPADVALLVLFLAADDSGAITNQSYIVDGGWA